MVRLRGLLPVLPVCLAVSASPVLGQQYPSRPITIMTGYTPGATSDLVARTIGDALQAKWGQPVVIDNRPGSGSNIAATHVARAAPDGYTLMVATDATLTSNLYLYKAVPFDPVKDFTPVINAAANIIVLAVHPGLPVRSVAELIAHARKNPGALSYGSSGVGSPHHLAGELLAQMAGLKMTHVPDKGGGLAANDLLGGHIPMAFLSLAAARALGDSGKIRILAVVEKTRYAGMPDVPTIAETLAEFEMSSWLALVAPAGTPQPVVRKLNETVAEILKSEAVTRKLGDLGLAVIGTTPDDLASTVKSGLEVRGRLVKAAGISPE